MSGDELDELRAKVALSCRVMGTHGLTHGATGHVSARIPGTDRVLIKAKGPAEEALEFATPRDIITIDIEGAVVEAPPGLQPPNETAMHLAIYRHRPEVMSVVHSHPDWIVVLTACGKTLQPVIGAYDAEIATSDALVGRLLDALSEDGRLGQTLVVVTGDHGEMLGEHGEQTHGFFIYDAAVHIPLIMAGPGLPALEVDEERHSCQHPLLVDRGLP